jgi:hypothetical protein
MKRISIYFYLMGLLVIAGCKKDSSIEGPELVDIFGTFEVLEPLKGSKSTVNFANGDVVQYACKLSIRTSWTIEVIGLNSGARKVFTGNEKDFVLHPIVWDGTITFAPFFRKNEP